MCYLLLLYELNKYEVRNTKEIFISINDSNENIKYIYKKIMYVKLIKIQ